MRAPSSPRSTCRCRPISKRASATPRGAPPRRSASPPSRPGRRLDRGRDRQQGRAAVRHRQAAERVAAAVDGGARAAVRLHPHRARGELPARQARPRRHDQAPASLRARRRRRADGARPARSRRRQDGLRARCRSRSTSWPASRASRSRTAELEAAGVKRISLATSLYRAAMSGLIDAAKEVKEKGTFGYLDTALPTPALNAFMRE